MSNITLQEIIDRSNLEITHAEKGAVSALHWVCNIWEPGCADFDDIRADIDGIAHLTLSDGSTATLVNFSGLWEISENA